MNVFNRIVVLLLLLKVAALAIAIAVLAWTIPNETIDWLREAVDWIEEHNQDTEAAILTAICVAVVLVVLIVLFVELRPTNKNEVKVTGLKSGSAVVSTAAIALRLEEAVKQLPHIGDAKAMVRGGRRGVEVVMDLHVDAEANLAEVSEHASETVRDVLNNRMQVRLASPPLVHLHYRELRLRRPGAVAVTPPVVSPADEPLPSAEDPLAAETPPADEVSAVAVEPESSETAITQPETETEATVAEVNDDAETTEKKNE